MKFTREDVLAFATKAHAGQKRKDGKDYISHPIAVAEIAEKKMREYVGKRSFRIDPAWIAQRIEVAWIVGVLHDTIEDTQVTYEDLAHHFGEWVASLVVMLSNKHENYFDFITSMVDPIAIIVKLADLEHNMSDLKEGSLKDKYRFAHAYLTKEIYY